MGLWIAACGSNLQSEPLDDGRPFTRPPAGDGGGGDSDGGNSSSGSGGTSSGGGGGSSSGGSGTSSGGDLSLRRDPKPDCSTPVSDATLAQVYPGYTKGVFVGTANDVQTEAHLCGDVLSLALGYAPPQINLNSAPALFLARDQQIPGNFTMSWIVESVTKTGETEESFVGVLLIARKPNDPAVLALALRHRTATGELVLHHGALDTPTLVSLGAPTPPYRVQWSVARNEGQLSSTLRITDGLSDRSETVVDDALGDDALEVTYGINRGAPGGQSRLTVSELILP